MDNRLVTSLVVLVALGFGGAVQAGVISVDTGFEVTYGINMNPGSSNGNDIQRVFIFEWDDSNFNVDYRYSFLGRGKSFITHTIDFEPSSALLIGYGAGIPNVGDEKDHLYMITDDSFAESALGIKWSAAFPGVPPNPRIGHSAMVNLLRDADAGSDSALAALTDFVTSEGYVAAFDPSGGFTVVEWTAGGPVGGPIPEPATLALMGLGLAGIGYSRKRKTA